MHIPLFQLADVRVGYAFRSRMEVVSHGDTIVVQMKDLQGQKLDIATQKLDRVDLPFVQREHLLRVGDILFRSRGSVNDAALVTGTPDRAVLSAPMLRIRPLPPAASRHAKGHLTPHTSHVLPEYLYWFLNHADTQRTLYALSDGTKGQKLNKKALENLAVPVPPVRAQLVIAQAAEAATQEAALRRKIADIKEKAINQTLMHYANHIDAVYHTPHIWLGEDRYISLEDIDKSHGDLKEIYLGILQSMDNKSDRRG